MVESTGVQLAIAALGWCWYTLCWHSCLQLLMNLFDHLEVSMHMHTHMVLQTTSIVWGDRLLTEVGLSLVVVVVVASWWWVVERVDSHWLEVE